MASLISSSFAGDPLLTKIAVGSADRISKTQNANGPSVQRIQEALPATSTREGPVNLFEVQWE